MERAQAPKSPQPARDRPQRIVIDLTPMLPGGANGGAKVLVTELLHRFRELARNWHFVLLTPEVCHDELAALESSNVEALCVLPKPEVGATSAGSRLRELARAALSRVPPAIAQGAIDLYWKIAHRPNRSGLLRELDAQLLFCPFTAPFHHTAGIPTVSVVYDLQFMAYPEFFGAEERFGRAANFRDACNKSSTLVCISDYVRQSVLEHSDIAPAKVTTIPIQMANRLGEAADREAVLARFGLTRNRFLLYPANFWPHKNHRMLLTALGQYVDRHPDSDLQLVCSGHPGPQADSVRDTAERMGLGQRCHFPGYVSSDELRGLFGGCRAVVFPSLYEGFGMPVLEAMEVDVPVACSDRTSLPEVAGEAALLFDPRAPGEIRDAIERLDTDEDYRQTLIERGRVRRARYAHPEAMALSYLELFAQLMGTPPAAAR